MECVATPTTEQSQKKRCRRGISMYVCLHVCMCVCMYVCMYAGTRPYIHTCVCVCARASRYSCAQIDRMFVSPPCIKLTIKASNSWTCSRTWSNHRKRTIEKILTLRALFFFGIRLCCSAFLDGPALSNGQGDRATVLSMLSPTSFVAALGLHSSFEFAPYTPHCAGTKWAGSTLPAIR